METFAAASPVLQALLAGVFTWLMTAAGAALVFGLKSMRRGLSDLMLGFAAGVMIAASVWSLLIPAMEMEARAGRPEWVAALVGFICGGAFLFVLDRILPHLHPGLSAEGVEGVATSWSRATLLLAAITLHNIPEGLAVGVAFGAAAEGEVTSVAAAATLALGIGIQNLPEGAAVSLPLRGAGLSRRRSFFYGQLSAVVEPMAAVLGAALVVVAAPVLPYMLAFAAGAMIYVVVEEVIPESQRGANTDLATGGAMAGFIVMMLLDVILG
ncbi:MAG: ZIP family metal transporter [Thermoleophilia bacterium]|nr:ZIP family metal transporter [Thermoleophilia bacterium]